jgi:hypothetical protein
MMSLRNVIGTVLALLMLGCSAQAIVITADADGFVEGADISNAFAGMTLSSLGRSEGLDGKVYAYSDELASTGSMVFGHNLENHTQWYWDQYPEEGHPDDFALRIDFDEPVNCVSLDMVGTGEFDYVSLWGYGETGDVIVGEFSSAPYEEVCTLTVALDSYDIAYVVAGGFFLNGASYVVIDNLVANVPEPGTVVLLGLGVLAAARRRKRA